MCWRIVMNKDEIEQIKRYYSITNEEFKKMYLQARKVTFANYIPTRGRPIAIFTGGTTWSRKEWHSFKNEKRIFRNEQRFNSF